VIDQIGGWLTHGVGNSYGKGYDYRILNKWMKSLIRTGSLQDGNEATL
jgi:hypothetical protein